MTWNPDAAPDFWADDRIAEERREAFGGMVAVTYALATCLALGLALFLVALSLLT